MPHSRVQRGFTLIEFIVSLVVIGIGAAILTGFVTPVARSADPMIQAQARAIATAYMDEILLREHGACSNPGSGNRGGWEEVFCYDGLDEAPHDQFGNPIASLSDYTVLVSVAGNAPATIGVNVAHAGGGINYSLQSQRGDY
ncbi:type II secretion system protein [Wenzhouxiangella sp. AB-CW3]|uniref:type IV pilus modification PilV family protein n=1 Tax=Wenzhouxiangella sp. AB-CW3 TaxID=2771012 RepID=UPI00168ACDFD|nr:type II secretion system protein [Wenzhouxiangella sp. AB-CW3]QOC23830.1 type II secretion system protein [Wenzhouxiangella sp. AB-CW3]